MRAACVREGKSMEIMWIFLILAIVCALFSDKIDAAFKADQKLKRIILIFSGGILLVCMIAVIARNLN